MPYSFTFDAGRCTGCQACQLACTIENRLEPDRSWRRIHAFNDRHAPGLPAFHLSLACNHCGHAACMEACPALAYSRDPETGAVLVDEDRCIGCGYCTWACPFDAPRFDQVAGTVSKCTFCNDRIKAGQVPACADYCPTGALGFEWLEEAELEQPIAGFPRTELRPAIRIEPAATDGCAADAATAAAEVAAGRLESRITVRSEWPLLILTLSFVVLVALFGTHAVGRGTVGWAAFLTAGVLALGAASAHLGVKRRAWRAVLNVAHSPLSRETVLLSAFFAGATVVLGAAVGGAGNGAEMWRIVVGPEHAGAALARVEAGAAVSGWTAVAWATAVLGFAALLAVDRVYRYTNRPGTGTPHSAGALLTGVFLWGVFAGVVVVAAVLGALKLGLYAKRKWDFARVGRPWRPAVSALRVGVGLLLPSLLWSAGADYALVAVVAVGELVDRLEYYDELETMTPARQMGLDLRAALAARRSVAAAR